MTTKIDTLAVVAKLAQTEVAGCEHLKARAIVNATERAAITDDIAAFDPQTAVGAQALAEVKRALSGQTGTAMDRILARHEARQAG